MPGVHYRMNMKDVPFVVGTVSHQDILQGVYRVLSFIVLEGVRREGNAW